MNPGGHSVLWAAEVASTNDEAKRLARDGVAHGTWVGADRQSAGRGRRGNAWHSLDGNLFASVLLRPQKAASDWAQLSFAAALAVSDMLAGCAPSVVFSLKWPNDVLAEGRKIAGVLLESESGTDGRPHWLVIGFGVNLAAFPPDTEFPAICLSRLGISPPAPHDAALRLAAAFQKWYEAWLNRGFAPLREAWLARVSGLGRRIGVRLAREETQGVFEGIDDSGALLLSLPAGTTRIISAGEVFW